MTIKAELGTGWDDIDSTFADVIGALEGDNAYDVTEAGAEVVLSYALEAVPVDTGELKDSGAIERDGDGAVVVFTAEHAEPVEYGTSRQAAQPYLRPAQDNHLAEVEAAMLKVLQAGFDGVSRG